MATNWSVWMTATTRKVVRLQLSDRKVANFTGQKLVNVREGLVKHELSGTFHEYLRKFTILIHI